MTGALPANLYYALRHSPTLDISIVTTEDGFNATVTTSTREHRGSDPGNPAAALQAALLQIGLDDD
jgi:hypothetical protein